MPRINEAERKVQDRILALFHGKAGLNYTYYGDLHGQINANTMPDKLTAWLVGRGYSRMLAEKAVSLLAKTVGNSRQGRD